MCCGCVVVVLFLLCCCWCCVVGVAVGVAVGVVLLLRWCCALAVAVVIFGERIYPRCSKEELLSFGAGDGERAAVGLALLEIGRWCEMCCFFYGA